MRSPCTSAKSSPRLAQLEKAHVQQGRPNATKNKFKKKRLNKFSKNKKMVSREIGEVNAVLA